VDELAAEGKVQLHMGHRMTDLLSAADGSVIGIAYVRPADDVTGDIRADAVILTTGGFSSDRAGLLAQHVPQMAALPTTNGPWATGDGVKVATKVGAALVHMDQVGAWWDRAAWRACA